VVQVWNGQASGVASCRAAKFSNLRRGRWAACAGRDVCHHPWDDQPGPHARARTHAPSCCHVACLLACSLALSLLSPPHIHNAASLRTQVNQALSRVEYELSTIHEHLNTMSMVHNIYGNVEEYLRVRVSDGGASGCFHANPRRKSGVAVRAHSRHASRRKQKALPRELSAKC
jgi:hypothetical protein